MTNTMCIHGKAIYERCLECEEGMKRGEHGGFVREPVPSKELCDHTPLYTHDSVGREYEAPCPWCLQRELTDTRDAYLNQSARLVQATPEPLASVIRKWQSWVTDLRSGVRSMTTYEPVEIIEMVLTDIRASAEPPPAKQGPCPNCGAVWVSAELNSSPEQADLPKPVNYDLWKHLHDEHGLTLLQSELDEILRLAQPPVPELPILRNCLGNLFAAIQRSERFVGNADIRFAMREAAQALGPPYSTSTKEPSRDLLAYGYAPGNYMSNCLTCGQNMQDVDKRCRTCKPCAEKKMRAALGEQS